MNKTVKTSLKIGGVLLGIALLIVVSGVVWLYFDPRQMLDDPVFDTVAPELPPLQAGKAMLVSSKTNGFRHRDGIAGGLVAFEKLAKELGWDMYATENGAVFNAEQLSRFDKSPRRPSLTVLATADEKTYKPQYTAMGDDHPVISVHSQGDGRVFYSALGHQASPYDSDDYMQVLSKALLWVAGN